MDESSKKHQEGKEVRCRVRASILLNIYCLALYIHLVRRFLLLLFTQVSYKPSKEARRMERLCLLILQTRKQI